MRSTEGGRGTTGAIGSIRIRTASLEVGVTLLKFALRGENPAPHMRVKNAIAIGDVTFHWDKAKDESKYTENNVEESIGGTAEEANTTCNSEEAHLADIRWRAWSAVRCTVVRCSSATASPKASWTQLREHVVVVVVVRALVLIRLLRPKFATAVADARFGGAMPPRTFQARWARFARARPLTTFHVSLLRTRRRN